MTEWQLRFDGGRQQRYFSSRRDLVACILRVSAHGSDPRFEIWKEGEPVLLADGREAGRRFDLEEVLDLREAETRNRLERELSSP